MATLTWQDVAGQVRAPDYSDSSAMITQGIAGLGKSVQDIIGAPQKQREEQLAREMSVLEMQQRTGERTANNLDRMATTIKTNTKERDMKEFGAAQSVLEAGAREAALSGKSYDDFLKSDAYLGLGEGARAYGASHLSDAYMRGDETRMNREERAADNARQERQFNRSFALQQQSAARQNREMNLREAALARQETERREGQGIFSKDAKTNLVFQERLALTAKQADFIRSGREKYGDVSRREAADKSGMNRNWWAQGSTEATNAAQAVEKATGKKVDDWMINKLLVEGVGGTNTWGWVPGRGNINGDTAEEYLKGLVEMQDAAVYNQNVTNQMIKNMREGARYGDKPMPAIASGIPAAPSKRQAPAAAPASGWTPVTADYKLGDGFGN